MIVGGIPAGSQFGAYSQRAALREPAWDRESRPHCIHRRRLAESPSLPQVERLSVVTLRAGSTSRSLSQRIVLNGLPWTCQLCRLAPGKDLTEEHFAVRRTLQRQPPISDVRRPRVPPDQDDAGLGRLFHDQVQYGVRRCRVQRIRRFTQDDPVRQQQGDSCERQPRRANSPVVIFGN